MLLFFNRWRSLIQQCSVLWKWSHSSHLRPAVLLCCGLGLPGLYFSSLPYVSATGGAGLCFFSGFLFKKKVLEVDVFIFIAENNDCTRNLWRFRIWLTPPPKWIPFQPLSSILCRVHEILGSYGGHKLLSTYIFHILVPDVSSN